MNIEILEEIGLTKSEIAVYLALLELGSSATGKIVDKSKASSSKIYEILDRLMQKGLVSFIIKSGVKYFEAAPPGRIMDYMKEKEEKFLEQKNALEKVLPELELKRKMSKYKSEATIFKGLKGGETAFKRLIDSMKKDDEWIGFIVSFANENYFNLLTKLHAYRAKKGLNSRIIFNDQFRYQGRAREILPHTKVKYMPDELKLPAIVNVAGNITLLNVMGEEITVFMIENKEVADSFRSQFEKLWNQKMQSFQGQEAVEAAYESILEKAKPTDDVVIFAAKPKTKGGADYNLKWNEEMRRKTKSVRLLYYGNTQENKSRAEEMEKTGCPAKIILTQQTLPISTVVAGDIALNTVWGENPVSFKIENKTVADSLRGNFELLWNQEAFVVKGIDALNSAFDDFLEGLEPGESYDVLGVIFGVKEHSFYDKSYSDSFKRIHQERIKKGVKARLLFQQASQESIKKYCNEIYKENYEAKILPYKTDFPVAIVPSNNQTCIIVHKKEPSVIIIKSREASQAFKKYFESFWNQDTKIVRGLDAVQEIFEEMLRYGACDFIGARGYFADARPKYMDTWEKRATESGFKMRNVVDKETKGHRITKFPFAETKYTLPKEFAHLSVFWIYGNKVIITNWVEKEPIAVIIENRYLYDMYKKQFEVLWGKKHP